MMRVVRAFTAVRLAAAFLVPLDAAVVGQEADAATCVSANITVTPLSGTIFYTDFSPSPPTLPVLSGHYTGYKITNATGAALSSPYVKLSGFTGGVVSLAPGESSSQPLGSLASGAANSAYFYLSASAATAAARSHTVSVYDRNPALTGATELCNTSFSFTSVTNTTQAAANKVTVASATSNPPGLRHHDDDGHGRHRNHRCRIRRRSQGLGHDTCGGRTERVRRVKGPASRLTNARKVMPLPADAMR